MNGNNRERNVFFKSDAKQQDGCRQELQCERVEPGGGVSALKKGEWKSAVILPCATIDSVPACRWN